MKFQELFKMIEEDRVIEVFTSGTSNGVQSVNKITFNDEVFNIREREEGSSMLRLGEETTKKKFKSVSDLLYQELVRLQVRFYGLILQTSDMESYWLTRV